MNRLNYDPAKAVLICIALDTIDITLMLVGIRLAGIGIVSNESSGRIDVRKLQQSSISRFRSARTLFAQITRIAREENDGLMTNETVLFALGHGY